MLGVVKRKPILGLLLLVPLLGPVATRKDGADTNDLVRRAVANYQRRELLRNDYTYLARMRWVDSVVRRGPRPHIIDTYEVMFLEGTPYMKHVARDDRPLPPDMQRFEDARLEAETKARRAGHGTTPAGLLGHRLGPKTAWTLDHLTDEFFLRRKGTDVVAGRRVDVIEAVPNKKPDPSTSSQDYARYFKTTLWIDVVELEIVKAREELIEDGLTLNQPQFSWSIPLNSENPQISESGMSRMTYLRGNVFIIQWTKIADGVWLPQKSYSKGKARVARQMADGQALPIFFINSDAETTYSGYKKFVVKTRITP